MANAEMHIIAGLTVSVLFAILIQNTLHTSSLLLVFGVILGVIASEFPDIDHPRSLPRKVLRGIMPAVIIFIFAYLFFQWTLWNHNLLIILGFIASPALLIVSYEYFIPRHRGATHKWPGLLVMAGVTIPFAFAIGTNIMNMLIMISFAVLGFATHVLLDHL